MRRLAAMLLACLTASAAHAESDAETLRRLDECFARTRMADAICENSLGVNAARLDCLKKSRDAQKECLDHVRMGPSAAVPAGAPSVAPAKTSSGGWTIGETTSPVDFSPLLVAELRPVAPASDGAPTALLLRCKSARTELSVAHRALGGCRPGDADAAMQTDGHETGHLHWLLSQLVALPGWEDGHPSTGRRRDHPSLAHEQGRDHGHRRRRLWRRVDLRSLRRRNGPRQIGGSMPLASIADRDTRPLTRRKPADNTDKDEIGFTLRPIVCCRFLRPLTDRRYVRMGL